MATQGKDKKLHKQTTLPTFGPDDGFNSKSSMKGKSKPAQQVHHNPVQTVVVKARLPFTSHIEESSHIKERTNKLFLKRFEGKLDENDKIIPTTLPSNAYHGQRRNSAVSIHFDGVLESLQDGQQLTEEDSFVPKSTAVKVSIFTAGDKKIFPERRPNTGAWKLGLRQYEQLPSKAREREELLEKTASSTSTGGADTGLDTQSVGSLDSAKSSTKLIGSTKAISKMRRQASEDSLNLRPTTSAAKMNTYLHAQYASADLPKLTKDQNKNYFGATGTENFFKTYRELKQRGEVLRDGYTALEELVLLPEEQNVLMSSVKTLETLGVLTPREENKEDDFSLDLDDNSSIGSMNSHFTPFAHTPTNTHSNTPKLTPNTSGKGFTPDLLAQRVMSFNKLAHDPNVAIAVSTFVELGSKSTKTPKGIAVGSFSDDRSDTTPQQHNVALSAAEEAARIERVVMERHKLMNGRHASSPEIGTRKTNTSVGGVVKAHKAAQSFTALRKISRRESLPPIHATKNTLVPTSSSASLVNSASNSVGHNSSNKKNSPKNSNLHDHKGPKSAHNSSSSSLPPRPSLSRAGTARSGLSNHSAQRPPSPVELGESIDVLVEEPDTLGFDSDSDSEQEFSHQIYSSKPFTMGNTELWSGINPHASLDLDLTPIIKRLDEPMPDDLALESSYSIASPRAIFLAGCLQHNIPPITVALIRKKISSTINLAHMGLGTKVAKVLAPCLKSIPYLQLLNLTDNNLDDEGLSVLLRAVSLHPQIEILDISQNIIGSGAAEALAVMLGDPNCRLQCLRMSNANIDDGECANFVEVLMNNRHLKELDMSNNLLGKDENLNAVQPDFVTGGESLSELLSNPNCPLRTLNLHWNMIRLEGAEVLCNSLRTNRVLTNLDLSYNALGNAAGILGAALIENDILVELNVGNNGIDEFGCFTLMVGLRENKSLRNLVLDGNPLGVQGGRILIKVATALGNRMHISAKNCDFTIHNSNFKFNINEPYGEFLLDLAVPFERAVVLEILNIGQIDASIEFTKFEYCEHPTPATTGTAATGGSGASGGVFVPLKLVRFDQAVAEHSRAEQREIRDLTAMGAISEHSWEDIFHTAQRYCTLDPEVLVKSDIEKLLREMRVNDMNTVIGEVFFTLDPMQFGWIDLYEFVGYMIKRSKAAKDRIHSMNYDSIFAISTHPNVRYVPPLTGKIRVRTVEGFNCDPDTVTFKPISNSQCRQVLKCAENSSHPLSLIIYAIEATRLHIEEAKLMYKQVMSKTEDSIMAIAVILQHMRSTDDALRVLKQFIGTDILRWRRLKQRLGSTLLPLIGIYSGFYHLDLSFPADRVCLKKLIERSVKNCDDRMKAKLGDTSQNGNWTCFRNEHHLDRPEERIIPKYYYPMPEKAKLEFDFININRPDVHLHRAVGEDTIIDLLLMTRLLDEHLVDWALGRLAEHGASVRKSCLSNGKPVWKAEVGRAVAVNDTVYGYHSALSARHKSYIKSQKREAMTKHTNAAKEGSGTKKAAKGHHHGDDHHHKSGTKRTSMVERDRIREEKERKAKELLAANKNLEIETFRSFNLKGKQHQMKAFWSKRLFEVMYESNGTDEMKSAAILEFLEIMMSTWWVYCRHISLILELFSIGSAAKSSMGSYRVEMVVMWFDHILDLQNFELILMVLNAEEQAAIYMRIGILNIFNPCKPEGAWQLDLMRYEERQVAKMLIHLSVVEPGDNWFEPVFVFDHGFQPIPGWSLSVVWLGESGLPLKGILTLEFFSGAGANMQNCLVDRKLRAMLCSLVLAPQRDLQLEYKINKQENFAVGMERKESIDPNNPVMMKAVLGAALKAGTAGSALTAISHVVQVDAPHDAHHDEHAHTEHDAHEHGAAPVVKHALKAYSRPHAVAALTALHTQIGLMSQLYYDPVQKKAVMDYTFRDANAHLKTCNVEWSYTDGDVIKIDPWRL